MLAHGQELKAHRTTIVFSEGLGPEMEAVILLVYGQIEFEHHHIEGVEVELNWKIEPDTTAAQIPSLCEDALAALLNEHVEVDAGAGHVALLIAHDIEQRVLLRLGNVLKLNAHSLIVGHANDHPRDPESLVVGWFEFELNALLELEWWVDLKHARTVSADIQSLTQLVLPASMDENKNIGIHTIFRPVVHGTFRTVISSRNHNDATAARLVQSNR